MPQHSSYHAARAAAALVDRSDRGWLVVSGMDRRAYLHGLLTNDIAALEAGRGCYAAYLTPQGRMIADLWVYELGDVVLLSMSRDVKPAVLAKLDQFIFSEDVKLGDVSETFAAIGVVGPRAAAAVASVVSGTAEAALSAMPDHGNVRGAFNGETVMVLRAGDSGVSGFDVVVPAAQFAGLVIRLHEAGAVDLDPEAAEALRVEAGVPKFHRDMDEETIPLEAGIEGRAISLTKGCYVGQEVIIRVLHRGHGRVARRLVGLTLDGSSAPASATPVMSDGREVGHITSAVISPAIGKPIALAYVHRDFVAPGTAVTVNGVNGVVTTTPFTA